MQRRVPRQIMSYPKQNDEEYAPEQSTTTRLSQAKNAKTNEQPDNSHTDKTDRFITDMAQGFVQAQAKIADHSTDITNQQIVTLLEKVNQQLENFQQPSNKPPDQSTNVAEQQASPSTGQQAQMNPKQQAENMVSQELHNLFSQLLQGKDKQNSGDSSGQTSTSQGSNSQSQDNPSKDKAPAMAAQTVAQVLAQTQYELSNELEDSLKKLKQVISESEKIANKISNLLGEEANTKKS